MTETTHKAIVAIIISYTYYVSLAMSISTTCIIQHGAVIFTLIYLILRSVWYIPQTQTITSPTNCIAATDITYSMHFASILSTRYHTNDDIAYVLFSIHFDTGGKCLKDGDCNGEIKWMKELKANNRQCTEKMAQKILVW
eukprot:792453_1